MQPMDCLLACEAAAVAVHLDPVFGARHTNSEASYGLLPLGQKQNNHALSYQFAIKLTI